MNDFSTPDLIVIEAQARAMRAAYMRAVFQALVARLRAPVAGNARA